MDLGVENGPVPFIPLNLIGCADLRFRAHLTGSGMDLWRAMDAEPGSA